jgi:peptidyl-prolyl cis-trans isomerase D
MLNLIRKHATSWLIKILLILVAIVFIFWGGYSYESREASRLAKVYDQFITYSEYQKAHEQMVENYRRQFGKMFSEDLLKQLDVKRQALEMLIQRQLVQHAAKELGLTASDEEVQHSILQYPVFLNEGKFEQQRYLQVLRQARMTPEVFEGEMATDLALQKVQAFIKRQASLSEDEILAEYQFTNTQIQLSYVVFDPKDFEAQIKPEENEISAYYNDHQDKYRDPEKRQFALVIFKADQYLDQVAVTDGEIQYYYEDNQKKYHKEGQVKARHILFKVESGESPEEEAKFASRPKGSGPSQNRAPTSPDWPEALPGPGDCAERRGPRFLQPYQDGRGIL